MLLVLATLRLADGTLAEGFATPAPALSPDEEPDLGLMQPQIFLPDGSVASFWMGMQPERKEAHARLYRALGREPGKIFPIEFSTNEGLARGITAGKIEGFYYVGRRDKVVVRV